MEDSVAKKDVKAVHDKDLVEESHVSAFAKTPLMAYIACNVMLFITMKAVVATMTGSCYKKDATMLCPTKGHNRLILPDERITRQEWREVEYSWGCKYYEVYDDLSGILSIDFGEFARKHASDVEHEACKTLRELTGRRFKVVAGEAYDLITADGLDPEISIQVKFRTTDSWSLMTTRSKDKLYKRDEFDWLLVVYPGKSYRMEDLMYCLIPEYALKNLEDKTHLAPEVYVHVRASFIDDLDRWIKVMMTGDWTEEKKEWKNKVGILSAPIRKRHSTRAGKSKDNEDDD